MSRGRDSLFLFLTHTHSPSHRHAHTHSPPPHTHISLTFVDFAVEVRTRGTTVCTEKVQAMVLGINWKRKTFSINASEVNVDRVDHTQEEWSATDLQVGREECQFGWLSCND